MADLDAKPCVADLDVGRFCRGKRPLGDDGGEKVPRACGLLMPCL